LNDEAGAWWRGNFGMQVTVTRVQILNREDTGTDRLNNAKVLIGDNLCGTIKNAGPGEWITVVCRAQGAYIKIQAPPNKYLNFCGLKVWYIGGGEASMEEG
jgi:hypothetical protein